MKSAFRTVLRWMLLGDALVAAAFSLLTAIKCPVRVLHWVVGMVVPECALWFAALPVCFGAAAWVVRRRGHRVLVTATLVPCAIALVLFLKPTAQAWWLARSLP